MGITAGSTDDQTYSVTLNYPPYEDDPRKDKHRYVEVDLCHVRAADGIRISFHFGRNGWLIEQAQVFQWNEHDTVCDPEWKEVAFVQAWSSKRED